MEFAIVSSHIVQHIILRLSGIKLLPAIGIIILLQAQGQATATPQMPRAPSFDVISIKSHPESNENYAFSFTPDGFSAKNCTLKFLVRAAFIIKDDRLLINLPEDKKLEYDIQSKVAEADLETFRQLSELQKRPMLQELLVDRFQLKFHTIKKDLPVYALVIDKKGLKLTGAKPGPDGKIQRSLRVTGKYTVVAKGLPTADLFALLSQMSGRYVVDRTALAGSYDFTLSFAPDPSVDPRQDVAFDGPVIFTALKEQLGLSLEPSTATFDAIVIDQVGSLTPN